MTAKQQTKPSTSNLIKRFDAYESAKTSADALDCQFDTCSAEQADEIYERLESAQQLAAKAFRSLANCINAYTRGEIKRSDIRRVDRDYLDLIIAAYSQY